MKTRNWIGVVVALVVIGLFGLYIRSHEITTIVGLVFGGGLVFAGILIDADHFLAALRIVRKVPELPPEPE